MNAYTPYDAKVDRADALSRDSVLLTLSFKDPGVAGSFSFIPGQFVELSLLGYGEIPVGLASSPRDAGRIQVSVRSVGNVSNAVHRLEAGDEVGVRGPFGNGFKRERLAGKDLLIVSGGCGIPPMRSLILDILGDRQGYGDVTLLYGSRTQQDLLFREEYASWGKGMRVLLTVDSGDAPDPGLGMGCDVGVVTNLLDKVDVKPQTVAVMCGPPVMYKFVIQKLLQKGMRPEDILVSLERRMKCGLGKCQHCTRGSKYVCLDGPVFTYKQMTDEYGGL
jgi:sulfhydrogenase subunit gamma (sulfur reductase)